MMTDQEIFDTVLAHLRKQGKCSTTIPGGRCQYRTEDEDGNTLMCAVGCLIPENEYDPSIEGCDVLWIAENMPSILRFTENLGLLAALQHVHDDFYPRGWECALAHVASKFGLKYEGLNS